MSKKDARRETFDLDKRNPKEFRKWFVIFITLGTLSSFITNDFFILSMNMFFSKNKFLIILPIVLIFVILMICSNSENNSFFAKTFLLGFSLGSLTMGLRSYADIFNDVASYNVIEHSLKINKSLLLAGISAMCYKVLSYSQNYLQN